MVNNKLDYKVNEDDENKEQCPSPGEKVDSQEDAGKQAINKGFGARRPVPVLYVVEG